MKSNRPMWLVAAPFIFLMLWSGGYAVAKVGLLYTQPMTLLALRYACVVVIMLCLFAILRPPLPKSAVDWGHLIVVGLLIQTLYFGLTYLAFISGVAAGTVAVIHSFHPILVALIAPRWTGEHVGWKRWCGFALALCGTAIVIGARAEVEPPTLIGFACAALALFGITGATLWEKKFGLSHHPVTANLIGYAAGFLGIAPFMLVQAEVSINWTWDFGLTLGYLVIGNSVIAVGLLLAMIREGEVSKVSALFFLIPPVAAVMAWFLLDEIMPPLAWAGLVAAGAGVWIATRTRETAEES